MELVWAWGSTSRCLDTPNPNQNPIRPHTVARALCLGGPLGSMVELEMVKTLDMRRARQQFSSDVRAALRSLPQRAHNALPL